MSGPINPPSFGPPSFNPSPMACEAFRDTFASRTYDPLKFHGHLHNNEPHVGDRIFVRDTWARNDFVIRNQFGPDGNLQSGFPEILPRF